jgi:hypothetical protein
MAINFRGGRWPAADLPGQTTICLNPGHHSLEKRMHLYYNAADSAGVAKE